MCRIFQDTILEYLSGNFLSMKLILPEEFFPRFDLREKQEEGKEVKAVWREKRKVSECGLWSARPTGTMDDETSFQDRGVDAVVAEFDT